MESVIQLLIFGIYVGYILFKYGQLKSISESYYYVGGWFTFLCYSIGILQLIRGELMFFISGLLLVFVGAATDFKGWHITKIVHNIGAIGSILFSLIGIYLYYGIWWPIFPILIAYFLLKEQYKIFWTEVIAFLVIIIILVNN